MEDYDIMTGSWTFWLWWLMVVRQGFRISGMRVTPRSYGQVSFIMCLHWKHVCWVCFIMCSHWIPYDSLSGCYLGHVSDASGGLCLVAVSHLDICGSWTDKPLWFDGYLWLDDSLCFIFKLSLNNGLFRVYILVHLYSISQLSCLEIRRLVFPI